MPAWRGAVIAAWAAKAGLVASQPQEVEELADVVPLLGGVSEHRRFSVDQVAIAAPMPVPLDISGLD